MTTSGTGKGGFTLPELLLVIIIIGILAGVSFPGLRKTFDRLQLDDCSRELQQFMNYLQERSVIERKVIYLYIDAGSKKYWAQFQESNNRIRTYSIPAAITIETKQPQVKFFPDGKIEAFSARLTGPGGDAISLTSEGVFGSVKIQSED